ncbi:MAG TPA: hypothetical protein VFD26_05450 [Methyloceanibacter sp.]|nr:hypothetical protein [Methyloceanibacter sp.]
MTYSKTLARVLIAAVLVAGAGPALAKKYQAADGTIVQKPVKKKSSSAKEKCVRAVPPWLYNPRFMNRGMLKQAKKCR